MRHPQDLEGRTKLLGIKITPEMYDDLKKLELIEGTTINYKVYLFLKQYLKDNEEQLTACRQLIESFKK